MEPRVATLLLFATVVSGAARAQAVAPSYADIVTMYRSGDFDAAVAALQRMSPKDVKNAVSEIYLSVRTGAWAGGIEPIEAAAVLHTQLAIEAWVNTGSRNYALWDDARRRMGLVVEEDSHSTFVPLAPARHGVFQGQQSLIAMDYARGTWKPVVVRSKPTLERGVGGVTSSLLERTAWGTTTRNWSSASAAT